MKIELYSNSKKGEWDQFIKNAKNPNFLFFRDFMEYHSDRFKDFSLMVYDKKDRLIALLLANRVDNTLYSHQGLTYGGFVLSPKIKLASMIEIAKELKEFLKKEGIKSLIYKPSPYIYHKMPSFEDIFALEMVGMKIQSRDIQEVIDLKKTFRYSNGRKHSIRRAKEFGFEIQKSEDFESFWMILESVLKSRHNSKPVHTKKEIVYLHSLFPKNIELFLVSKDKKIYAGAVAFVNESVVKLQYVANYNEGRELGALDLLIDRLLNEYYTDKEWFDFGTSSDKNGINYGLIDQKERFGASAILCDSYILEI